MGGGSGRRDYDDKLEHGGRWRSFGEWPPRQSRETTFYLRHGGGLSEERPGIDEAPLTYIFDPDDPVPTIGGGLQNPWRVDGLVQGGGYDQRGQPGFSLTKGRETLASRPDVLVFRTPPLEADTELTGDVYIRLWVKTSAKDTDFTAKLVDEYPPSRDYPNGYALNLADEIIRLSYRDGRLTRELAEPDKLYQVEIGPMPASNLFKKGHRIRIDISSSNFPQFEVNPNTGASFDQLRGKKPALNTIFVDAEHPSIVILPVVLNGV